MPPTPSKSKQSRTHQSAVRLPPCHELIKQADALSSFPRGAMAKFPPIPPLVQRAPGQAPYARPERRKGMMMPPPPTAIYPHIPLSRGSTQPIPTSYPKQRNTNSELGVAVVSSNGDYYTLMNQANPSFTRVSAVPLHGVYMVPALPISQSSRKYNSDARQTDAKSVPEHSKGKKKTQRTANQ